MLRVSPRNSDALGSVSMSGPFSELNILRGTLMRTGPGTDAQQTKQCLYNIPRNCGWCQMDEASRHLEVCIKEHKYSLTQDLDQKSKSVQHAYEEGHKIVGNKRRFWRVNRTPHARNTRNPPTSLWLLIRPVSPAWTPLPSRLLLSLCPM
jgi:hypothetical protein